MSDEYTYDLPDSHDFMFTLRRFLEEKGEEKISELLVGATCDFRTSTQFSRVRWNAYYTTLYINVRLEHLPKITDDLKQEVLQTAEQIFPPSAGYDLMEINIVPMLESPPSSSVLESMSVTSATNLIRFNPIWGEPSTQQKHQCDVFMIMPFKQELDSVYSEIVRPTILSLDLTILRGDDPFSEYDIMFDIWSMLNSCRLVIADCTGKNSNVFYELGIAHTLGKPVIMLAQDLQSHIPFDVNHRRAIEYNTNFTRIDDLKSELRRAVQSILDIR